MKFSNPITQQVVVMAALIGLSPGVWSFDSGSTGFDGALNPLVNTTLQLPPDGVFNFTTVNIPSGVILSFSKNTTNTPVTILASGDVTIAGTIRVNGGGSTNVGASGDGNTGDDGIPGNGGPGGFNGGRGGDVNAQGGDGLGPGGGTRGLQRCTRQSSTNGLGAGGGGGGFGGGGARAERFCTTAASNLGASGGPAYGVSTLLPLIGGSGGGGAHGGLIFGGSGGGGGAGAILIASSGTLNISGSITAFGASSGSASGTNSGGSGGGGSGGAIRLVATTLQGNGAITATGGGRGSVAGSTLARGGGGANGRIRLEADSFLRTANTNPTYSFSDPREIFVAGLPSLRITNVAGVAAPDNPTGSADIVLPETTPNPVDVIFASSAIPLGNTVTLTVRPATGGSTSTVSDAIVGTEDNGTATATIDLPDGPSVLLAQVSFTVTASLGNDLSRFAEGEQVERVIVASSLETGSMTTLVTASGKEYTWPSNAVAAF